MLFGGEGAVTALQKSEIDKDIFGGEGRGGTNDAEDTTRTIDFDTAAD